MNLGKRKMFFIEISEVAFRKYTATFYTGILAKLRIMLRKYNTKACFGYDLIKKCLKVFRFNYNNQGKERLFETIPFCWTQKVWQTRRAPCMWP